MATRFLTDDQLAVFGRYGADPPDPAVLERFFFLDDADRALVAKRQSSPAASVAGEDRRAGQAPEPAAAVDQVLPDASAGEVQAAGGDGQAAQVAAQAYPISTKEAVAAAAEKAEAGQGAGTGAAPAGARSTPSRPSPQQTREEPRGR